MKHVFEFFCVREHNPKNETKVGKKKILSLFDGSVGTVPTYVQLDVCEDLKWTVNKSQQKRVGQMLGRAHFFEWVLVDNYQ
jgi:hypothetical protein